jgi:hypothetical protein
MQAKSKEREWLEQLWNYVCLGACCTHKQQDRWLKALTEIEKEITRHEKSGCKCLGRKKK